MSEFEKGDRVIVRSLASTLAGMRAVGEVTKVLPHPYLPSWLEWLSRPNYLVRMTGQIMSSVFPEDDLVKYNNMESDEN